MSAPSTFTTKSDAEAWLADERRLLESGDWQPPAHRRALSAAATQAPRRWRSTPRRWLAERRVKGEPLRPSTVLDYERALRLYITPHLGDLPVAEITRADVRNWHTTCCAA